MADTNLAVIKITNDQPDGNPLTYSNFLLLFPQTSFPELPDNSFLVDFGYYVFKSVTPPIPPPFTNVDAGPYVLDQTLDAWTNSWVETPFTPDQMAQAQQVALYNLTQERNQNLLQCDWTQLPDVPLTDAQVAEWRTYRQELRDYIDTVTDPFNPPAWPVPPAS